MPTFYEVPEYAQLQASSNPKAESAPPVNSILRTLVDTRERQIQKSRIAFGNRLSAMMFGADEDFEPDHDYGLTEKYYNEFLMLEKGIDADIEAELRNDPVYPVMIGVKGIGPMYAAKLLAMIDFSRAPTVSSLWKFAGYGVTDGKADRPHKGKKLEYNKRLKTTCYLVGTSFLRARSPYRKIYDEAKEYYQENRPDWSKIRIHKAAQRKMVKIFLSHLWVVGRTIYGLPVSSPYIIGRDGHSHELLPQDFGWKV